jgi:hypothetical protein
VAGSREQESAPEATALGDSKCTSYELLILVVSILSFVNLAIMAALPWAPGRGS